MEAIAETVRKTQWADSAPSREKICSGRCVARATARHLKAPKRECCGQGKVAWR